VRDELSLGPLGSRRMSHCEQLSNETHGVVEVGKNRKPECEAESRKNDGRENIGRLKSFSVPQSDLSRIPIQLAELLNLDEVKPRR
jgi:hypothetical protein